MGDETTIRNVAYAIFAISFFIMIYFITKQARENRLTSIDQHAPRIAGSDELSGRAKNPQQLEKRRINLLILTRFLQSLI